MTTIKPKHPRPTSPHISIYKKQITSVSSIVGRLCGVASFISVILVAFLIVTIAFGRITAYDVIALAFTNGNFIRIVSAFIVFGTFFVWFFFLATLLRHAFWNYGYLLKIKTARNAGYICFSGAFLLACIFTKAVINTCLIFVPLLSQ